MLGESSHLAGGLPIFVMAGISALASIWLRDVAPRTHRPRRAGGADRRGRGLRSPRSRPSRARSFSIGAAIAGLGFGPAFAGVFRALSLRAPADERAALLSAVYVVSYLAFSVPAIIAGAAVTELGLRDTAEIYGLALIAIAAVALALSGNLEGPEAAPPAPIGPPATESAAD